MALFWVGTEFYTTANLTIIGASVTVPLLIGTCSGFALLAGVVDLSIGSCAGVMRRHFRLPDRPPLGRVAGGRHRVLVGLAIGLVNAIAIVGFGANPLAATLGMLTGLLGLQYVITGQDGLITSMVTGLYCFSNRQLGPLPLVFVLVLVVVGVAYYVVAFSRLGRHIRAVGGDEVAAGRAGIRVKRIRVGALLLEQPRRQHRRASSTSANKEGRRTRSARTSLSRCTPPS